MDDFYRLFFVPGMGHCTFGGNGAKNFGRAPRPGETNTLKSVSSGSSDDAQKTFDSAKPQDRQDPTNLLLALVDWVERGRAPNSVVGVTDDGKTAREHCRYPQKSRWNGERWECI